MENPNTREGERCCRLCKEWKAATRANYAYHPESKDKCQLTCRACERLRSRTIRNSQQTAELEKSRVVYFLRVMADHDNKGRVGLIKVGTTANLKQRIYSLRSDEHVDVVIMGVLSGGLQKEGELKDRFHLQKKYGQEWLAPTSELLDWILSNTRFPNQRNSSGVLVFDNWVLVKRGGFVPKWEAMITPPPAQRTEAA